MSITHLGLIKVDGPDAKKFLQGQLTCHLEELTLDSFRLGAHCNVQGRALATFYIFYWHTSGFLYEFGKTVTNVQSIIQELTKSDVCYLFELSSKIYQLYCV